MNASLVSGRRSYSLLNRRLVPSQANVRSTTHRLGSIRKPAGGMILDQSITALAGAHTPHGLCGCLTISIVQPNVLLTHSSNPALYPPSVQMCCNLGISWLFLNGSNNSFPPSHSVISAV